MRALILAIILTGTATAADITGAGKIARPISIAVEGHGPGNAANG